MKNNVYIINSGQLVKKDNTLCFLEGKNKIPNVDKDDFEINNSYEDVIDDFEQEEILTKKILPIENINAIYCMNELRFNTKLLNFLGNKNIPMHFFNYYGTYIGSFIPRAKYQSGILLVEQVKKYSDNNQRMKIAKEFVRAASQNILNNLYYYKKKGSNLTDAINQIEDLVHLIYRAKYINELMGIEGKIHTIYYSSWERFLYKYANNFQRSKQPPLDPINTLISYTNTLVYTLVLNEILQTQLNPLISFLHEPSERRYSLSLDIAEIFKPIIADKVIFSLINNKRIDDEHFTEGLNFCHLNQEGKKIVLKEFDDKITTTLFIKKLNKDVSIRYLIRLECYKLIKAIMNIEEYKAGI